MRYVAYKNRGNVIVGAFGMPPNERQAILPYADQIIELNAQLAKESLPPDFREEGCALVRDIQIFTKKFVSYLETRKECEYHALKKELAELKQRTRTWMARAWTY